MSKQYKTIFSPYAEDDLIEIIDIIPQSINLSPRGRKYRGLVLLGKGYYALDLPAGGNLHPAEGGQNEVKLKTFKSIA